MKAFKILIQGSKDIHELENVSNKGSFEDFTYHITVHLTVVENLDQYKSKFHDGCWQEFILSFSFLHLILILKQNDLLLYILGKPDSLYFFR